MLRKQTESCSYSCPKCSQVACFLFLWSLMVTEIKVHKTTRNTWFGCTLKVYYSHLCCHTRVSTLYGSWGFEVNFECGEGQGGHLLNCTKWPYSLETPKVKTQIWEQMQGSDLYLATVIKLGQRPSFTSGKCLLKMFPKNQTCTASTTYCQLLSTHIQRHKYQVQTQKYREKRVSTYTHFTNIKYNS